MYKVVIDLYHRNMVMERDNKQISYVNIVEEFPPYQSFDTTKYQPTREYVKTLCKYVFNKYSLESDDISVYFRKYFINGIMKDTAILTDYFCTLTKKDITEVLYYTGDVIIYNNCVFCNLYTNIRDLMITEVHKEYFFPSEDVANLLNKRILSKYGNIEYSIDVWDKRKDDIGVKNIQGKFINIKGEYDE